MAGKELVQYDVNWSDESDHIIRNQDADGGYVRQDYEMPKGKGRGWVEVLQTDLGLALSNACRNFEGVQERVKMGTPENPVEHIYATFEEPTFYVSFIRGGLLQYQEREHGQETRDLSANAVFFGHLTGLNRDCAVEVQGGVSVTYNLAISLSLLKTVLGAERVSRLLEILDISQVHSGTVKNIPLDVSNMLRDAISPKFTGDLRLLHAQSKVFEFLCNLALLTDENFTIDNREGDLRGKVQDIYNFLTSLDSKPPTLQQLALQTGLSTRVLNEAFVKEYGLTIHAFMLQQRMQKAHDLLEGSNHPIKMIAGSLGYNHVNNFTNAFKRQFGYPPGKLRK